MPDIISRREAHTLGHTTFYTGKLCRNGHLAVRYVQNGACKDCINWKRERIPKGNNVLVVPVVFDGAPTPEEMLGVKAMLIAWAPAALENVRREAAAQVERARLTEVSVIERRLVQPMGDEDFVAEPTRSQLVARLAQLKGYA